VVEDEEMLEQNDNETDILVDNQAFMEPEVDRLVIEQE
jgi:hypothetical protein